MLYLRCLPTTVFAAVFAIGLVTAQSATAQPEPQSPDAPAAQNAPEQPLDEAAAIEAELEAAQGGSTEPEPDQGATTQPAAPTPLDALTTGIINADDQDTPAPAQDAPSPIDALTDGVIDNDAQATAARISSEEDDGLSEESFFSVRTESPRATIDSAMSILAAMEEETAAYRIDKTSDRLARIENLIEQFASLIDLSDVPIIARRETGLDTMLHLFDILGRISPPPILAIPSDADFEATGEASWRVPRTPLRLIRVESGPRAGEFLFSSRTVVAAPRFYDATAHLPMARENGVISWSRIWPQLTGPLVPPEIGRSMPPSLLALWFDTPAWKVIFVLASYTLITVGLLIVNQYLRRIPVSGLLRFALRVAAPITVIISVLALDWFTFNQINLSGRFSQFDGNLTAVVLSISGAWLVWTLINGVSDIVVQYSKVGSETLNASLLRLGSRVVGGIAVIIVLATGANALGLPVLSVVAGLGIGGLAVALAIRPTLENLIGGVILVVDKPVRLGDFCAFGDFTGTVEAIGVRSTKVRKMDRTLITVPNAKLADMEITNFAQADKMMILDTLGLRYETTPDQLRYALVKLREMFHAHPKIDSETVRVRLVRYGSSSLDVEVRVYALTREWNDYFAIREDVLLRAYNIIEEAGTGFAFPSQTVYLSRDQGLSEEEQARAEKTVANWRRRGALPFPTLTPERIAALRDTLDYPPVGSADDTALTQAAAEPLAEPTNTPEPEPDTPDEKREKKEKRDTPQSTQA